MRNLSPCHRISRGTDKERFVYPAPEKDVEAIENIRTESPDYKKRNVREIPWLAWLSFDADKYLSNFKNPNEPSAALSSMDNVIVIACKDCETE